MSNLLKAFSKNTILNTDMAINSWKKVTKKKQNVKYVTAFPKKYLHIKSFLATLV